MTAFFPFETFNILGLAFDDEKLASDLPVFAVPRDKGEGKSHLAPFLHFSPIDSPYS